MNWGEWGEWPSGLRHWNQNWKVPGSTPLDAWPGLGTQPHYKAPGDLWVELVENAVINIGLVRLSTQEWPKIARGTAKQQLKKKKKIGDKV